MTLIQQVLSEARRDLKLKSAVRANAVSAADEESKLPGPLPSILREIYQSHGTCDLFGLFRYEGPIALQSLSKNRRVEFPFKDAENALFIFGPCNVNLTEGENPPVYFLDSKSYENIKIARSLRQFLDFVATEYDAIVNQYRMDVMREHMILADIGTPEEFSGLSRDEVYELERIAGGQLPAAFVQFALHLGKSFPCMNDDFFAQSENLLWFSCSTKKSREEALKPSKPLNLSLDEVRHLHRQRIPDDALYLLATDDYLVRRSEGPNPPVHSFSIFNEDHRVVFSRLSLFFYYHYLFALFSGGRLKDDDPEEVVGGTWKLYKRVLLEGQQTQIWNPSIWPESS